MANVKIDDLDKEIMKSLNEYANFAADEMKKAVKDTTKNIRKEIQANAPRDTGAYAKSWAIKTQKETSDSIDQVVHSRTRYQLAHLLENGHAKRGGGRVPGQPHIKPAEEKGKEQLVEDIKNALSHT